MMAPPAQSMSGEPLPSVVAGLRKRFEGRGLPVGLVETHVSWVLLAGSFAYKIKKPVQLGFLDFGTLTERRRCCEEEVRLNRRLAAWLYLDVVPIRESRGRPALSGNGPVIEYAVKMRRLPPHAVAREKLERGRLDAGHLVRFAQRLAAFHAAADVASADSRYGSAGTVQADVHRALDALAALGPYADSAVCHELQGWFDARLAELAPRFAQRCAAGRVREGHGDLHLDNVIVANGDVTAFDCIEFDPALRWIDVMNDVAYLVMDLLAYGRRDLAYGFLDAYLEASGDHDGLDVLRVYVVYRAVVRALVHALRASAKVPGNGLGAAEYLRLAQQLAEPAHARLLITHGLPGAGKTQVSRQLLERAGAIRLRSDVERKRAADLAPRADTRAVADLYQPQAHASTYARLEALARDALRAGYPTIVDAAFLRREERERMRSLAAALRVPFTILHCHAPLPLLRERVRIRRAQGADASEADEQVLERLRSQEEPLGADERRSVIDVRTDEPLALSELLGRWPDAKVPPPRP